MKTQTSLLILSSVIGLVGIGGSVADSSGLRNQKIAGEDRPQSKFRYVILYDSVDPNLSQRYVEVLLDESAFREETLKELFALVSKRYRRPEWMFVRVATSLRQVATPEERDWPNISESRVVPEPDPHPSAILLRQDGNELIRYTPSPPDAKQRTVILRGKDPNP
ncbi:MAG: hypothetical protein AABO41_02210 [Acidobacteriota bacterium]